MTSLVKFMKHPMKCKLMDQLRLVEPSEQEELIAELVATMHPLTIGFLNQHGYNLCQGNKKVLENFLQCDYLFRDGTGMNMACKLNDIDPGMDMNGTDFIPELVEKVFSSDKEFQLFVYGTKSPWLEAGANSIFLGKEYHSMDGFQDMSKYVDHYKAHQDNEKLNLVVLALGMPKQEALAVELKQAGQGPALIICGGAIIDFQAGKFKRAPLLVRECGFEWAYRLIKEPSRMFQRYVIGIPLFFYHLLKNCTRDSS